MVVIVLLSVLLTASTWKNPDARGAGSTLPKAKRKGSADDHLWGRGM